jgi:hypothetical protein
LWIIARMNDMKKLIELKDGQCRFPLKKDDAGSFLFCGKKVFKQSYCKEHSVRCHKGTVKDAVKKLLTKNKQ